MIGSLSALCWTMYQQDLVHTFHLNFQCILWIWCNFDIILLKNFFSLKHLPKVLLLLRLWKLHHFKNVTTKMSRIMNALLEKERHRTKIGWSELRPGPFAVWLSEKFVYVSKFLWSEKWQILFVNYSYV